ncbi:MAG: HAMP domain-containing sensor histidine kinase [Thermoguttaceae bacterium]|nr:HAMP domain-containing sensor histidine kinase [Thermoguttaceae bacterium]
MKANTPSDSTEILLALRGLSHDMGASQMMLDHSFGRLKTLFLPSRESPPSMEDIGNCLSQVEACMRASKGYLDDVIRLSTSGAADMEPEPIEVAMVVDRVLTEQTPLLDERAVRVQVRTPLPAVWCHPNQLKQVLTNLVRNAVLHGCSSTAPQIVISQCLPPHGDDSMAAVRVHDNGPGLDPRRRREIFLHGHRLSGAHANGSGWGLPTARRICELFGGSLELDTNCATGTAFILALPDAADAMGQSGDLAPVEDGRQWRLQLDARHTGPSRHEHSHLANDECRMTNVE